LDKADSKMNGELSLVGAGSKRADQDILLTMASSKGAMGKSLNPQARDLNASAFSNEGKVIQMVGDVKELGSDEESEKNDEQEDGGTEGGTKKSKKLGEAANNAAIVPAKTAELQSFWFGREEAIGAASKIHNDWTTKTQQSGKLEIVLTARLLNSISSMTFDHVKLEAAVARSRCSALRLCLFAPMKPPSLNEEGHRKPVGDGSADSKPPAKKTKTSAEIKVDEDLLTAAFGTSKSSPTEVTAAAATPEAVVAAAPAAVPSGTAAAAGEGKSESEAAPPPPTAGASASPVASPDDEKKDGAVATSSQAAPSDAKEGEGVTPAPVATAAAVESNPIKKDEAEKADGKKEAVTPAAVAAAASSGTFAGITQ
jgi:hypothetical protein